MNGRTGLIERAAALLRDQGAAPSGAAPPGVAAATESSMQAAARPVRATPPAAPLLSRQKVLDRAHLAQAGIVMPWTSTSRIVEEYRIVKRNLLATWPSPDSEPQDSLPRVIMVTSARPREGKTFSSINLALAFAADQNLATILVDGDCVRQDASSTLGVPAEPGFTDIVAGTCALSDALVQTDIPNLLFLPCGPSGAHVPELLAGKTPEALFHEIAKCYPNHIVILDMPPCLASTDPAALALKVNQIVFVVEAEHTQRPEIESALNLISDCPQISFLLNLIPYGTSEHFGSYSYYYQPGNKSVAIQSSVD